MTCYSITEPHDPLPEIAWSPMMTRTVGHLCTGGKTVIEVSRESVGVKWCFVCRRHLPHDYVIKDYTEPNYYGPWGAYECPQCHQDHTLGFGMVRE
jgi:hypothetical protein